MDNNTKKMDNNTKKMDNNTKKLSGELIYYTKIVPIYKKALVGRTHTPHYFIKKILSGEHIYYTK